MDTILEQLRKTNMSNHISEGNKENKGDEASSPNGKEKAQLKGRYRCRVCGYIFDEAEEGRPFSTLTECPLCHVSPGGFQQIR